MLNNDSVIFSFVPKYGSVEIPYAIGYTLTDSKGKELEHDYLIWASKDNLNGPTGELWGQLDLGKSSNKEYQTFSDPRDLACKIHSIWIEKKLQYQEVRVISDSVPGWSAIRPCISVPQFLEDASISEKECPPQENEIPLEDPVKKARYLTRLYTYAHEKIKNNRVVFSFVIEEELKEPKAIGYTITHLNGEELERGYLYHYLNKSAKANTKGNYKNISICLNTLCLIQSMYNIWSKAKKQYGEVFAITDQLHRWIDIKPLHGIISVLQTAGIKCDDYPPRENEQPPLLINEARYNARLYLTAINKLNSTNCKMGAFDEEQRPVSNALSIAC